jgi:plasmid stabilization system protein ParE
MCDRSCSLPVNNGESHSATPILEEINRALVTLRENPQIGRVGDDISSDLRAFAARQRVIYHRVETANVTVLRILHGKMDATHHL